MSKVRLDVLLFDRGLVPSRERAKTTIMCGRVYVNGQKADKPGMSVDEDAPVEVKEPPIPFVSRGGLKLRRALSHFSLRPEGATVIDVGASTGGFTDCWLQNGAKKVYAVDVGYGQLAWSLRQDQRVVCMERTNIRHITEDRFSEKADFASVDVSFISLALVLPALQRALKEGARIVCLIKPQFEAGREKVGKNGVVRDATVHRDVLESVLAMAKQANFAPQGLTHSPIKGPKGNIEFLCLFAFGGEEKGVSIERVVEQAHLELMGGQP